MLGQDSSCHISSPTSALGGPLISFFFPCEAVLFVFSEAVHIMYQLSEFGLDMPEKITQLHAFILLVPY